MKTYDRLLDQLFAESETKKRTLNFLGTELTKDIELCCSVRFAKRMKTREDEY